MLRLTTNINGSTHRGESWKEAAINIKSVSKRDTAINSGTRVKTSLCYQKWELRLSLRQAETEAEAEGRLRLRLKQAEAAAEAGGG